MELRHLKVFIALAEELHFGRAASRLHVAQSAVSQTLRDLEAEISARLFERTSRLVQLTEAGQSFLAYAKEAVAVVDRGMRAAQVARNRGGSLKLRLMAAACLDRLAPIIAKFQRENPDTLLEIRDGSSEPNREALEGGYCDVAFLSLASTKRLSPAYAHRLIEASALAVVVPPRHRLAKCEAVQWKDLRGEHILNLQRDDEPDVRTRLDKRLADLGTISTAIEVAHPQTLLPLIAAGLGVALLPAFVAHKSTAKVCAVPLSGGLRGGVTAAWNPQRASEATQRFVTELEKIEKLGK